MASKPPDTRSAVAGFGDHDHAACIAKGIAAAEAYCARHRLNLTATRARTLEILLESHRAMGAYDILGRLSLEGRKPQPPVAYRALEFLLEHGFVHRIERLNAFVACDRPHEAHVPAFMICRQCANVAEVATLPGQMLQQAADDAGFHLERTVVEAEGLCPACGPAGTPP